MKRIFAFFIIFSLWASTSYAPPAVPSQNLPWVNSQSYSTLTAADVFAAAQGKSLYVTKNYIATSGTMTFTSNVVIEGGTLTCGTGGKYYVGAVFAAKATQVFIGCGSGDVIFGSATDSVKAEWFGVSTTETDANNAIYVNTALRAIQGKGTLTISNLYSISAPLSITIQSNNEKISIEGATANAGLAQTGTSGQNTIETTAEGTAIGWAVLNIKNLTLSGNSLSGHGLSLKRALGVIDNITIHTIGGDGIHCEGCIDVTIKNPYIYGLNTNGINLAFTTNPNTGAGLPSNNNLITLPRIHSSTGAGILISSATSTGSHSKGNTIINADIEFCTVGVRLYGARQNRFIAPWLEGNTLAIEVENNPSLSGLSAFANTFDEARITSNTNAIHIISGISTDFNGGWIPGMQSVVLDAGAAGTKFNMVTNMPKTVEQGLTDNGVRTWILSRNEDVNDSDYVSWYGPKILNDNDTFLLWSDNTGTARNVIGLNSNNYLKLFDGAGNNVFTGAAGGAYFDGPVTARDTLLLEDTHALLSNAYYLQAKTTTGVAKDIIGLNTSNYLKVYDGDGTAIITGIAGDLYTTDLIPQGHIISSLITAHTTTIVSCGTDPAFSSAQDNDTAGLVTVGAGVVTACTVSFERAFTRTPSCHITPHYNTGSFWISANNNAFFTITFTNDAATQKFSYFCIGIGGSD
jgi:hypothetical protein